MPDWIHRTNKNVLHSVASADLPEAITNYIEEPDLSAVIGQPAKYWKITGNSVSLINQAARDAIDTAELAVARSELADEIDRSETFMRAFALVVLDEVNILRTNAGLSPRTAAQLKSAVRNRLNT